VRTAIWAAGVEASRLASQLGELTDAEMDRAGRVTVEADLTLPGHPEVLALGDMVRVRSRDGGVQALLGVAPVAMQQGRCAAKLVRARLSGHPIGPFRYLDLVATISEANGRASIYLAAVSSNLIALAFIGQMSRLGMDFYAFALILLPVLAFVGVVTFQRLPCSTKVLRTEPLRAMVIGAFVRLPAQLLSSSSIASSAALRGQSDIGMGANPTRSRMASRIAQSEQM
jgi:hypothetical protein